MSQTIIPIVQVDAFADAPFGGNPAAVMPLDAWLDDDLLQAIAAENNLSETAFYLPDATGEADFELRWFTPTIGSSCRATFGHPYRLPPNSTTRFGSCGPTRGRPAGSRSSGAW